MKMHFTIGILGALAAAGCASNPGENPEDWSRPRIEAGPGSAPAMADPPAGSSPLLVINGESWGWGQIAPSLAEAAGAPVVEEIVLTSALRREFLRRGWTLTKDDIDAERAAYTENIESMGASQTGSALDSIRRARGLGPARFPALIERNAMLRRIVRDEVTVAPEEIDVAIAVRHGPRVRVRLIVVETERLASEIRGRLAQAGPELRARFAEEAIRSSIDPSGPRGGLNDPISPADPSLPIALRRAIDQTPVGELSAVVALDGTYALILPEERIGAVAVDEAEARPRAERELRLRKERLAMEEVARRMIDSAAVTVFDPSLRYGWESRRRR